MRPLECEITDDIRSELLEALLERGEKLSISRKRKEDEATEDWKFGNDWFQLSKNEKGKNWRVLFGSGIIGNNHLEETVEWFESRTDINWIWPPEGINEKI